ncbi:SIR2 family protein [Sorangium sp. So ce291]|uniref:SIR2 family NAD-dependent protein deacylase n=1 Tax=Sorangium sp. So ce291 TaxID=3133294 RepID=UPI003F6243A9
MLGELQEAYLRGRLLVFSGSSTSTAAGLPAWPHLAGTLAEHARSRGAPEAALGEIAALISQARRTDALSAARSVLGANEFCALVERIWSDEGYDVPPIASAIASLAPQLSGLITTSIDHLLERAFGGRWSVLARATTDLAQRRGYILKLHGTLVDRSTWVLTRDDHDRSFHADAECHRFLSAIFHAHTVLFVGHQLASDELDFILARDRALPSAQAPRHFGMVPFGTIGPSRRRALEAAGIRVVTYRDQDGSHATAASLLRALARAGSMGSHGERLVSSSANVGSALSRSARVETPANARRLRAQIEETFSFEELETFFADSFPDIRGGIASIVSPVHNSEYRAFKLVQYFERRHRLHELQTKIQERLR